MLPHPIRLRRPWEEVPTATQDRKAYLRRFNRPTGLDTWETVTLEIDRILYRGDVSLNGTPLGTIEVGEFFTSDITSLLRDANELCVEVDPATATAAAPVSHSVYIVEPDEPPGSPIGEVRLVIRHDLGEISRE
ncbi:MAG TPA: hypothetical protein VGJ15_07795 [Pirellulales bacterium]|jgi:hypothetical protein